MWVYVPGFFKSHLDSIINQGHFLAMGMTNTAVPVPWPWTVSWVELGKIFENPLAQVLEFAAQSATGTAFLYLIIFYIISVPAVFLIQREFVSRKALWVASVLTGFFYLHHIFSRSESIHLGEGFGPVIIGILSIRTTYPFFRKQLSWLLIAVLALVSFLSAGLQNNVMLKNFSPKTNLVYYAIGKDRIWIPKSYASRIDDLKKILAQYVPPNEPVLLAPVMTTFYPILGKESPVYDLYFVAPQTEEIQRRMIRELEEKKVRWAVVGNPIILSIDELRLSISHPIFWEYLVTHFELVTDRGLRPGYFLMRRKSFL